MHLILVDFSSITPGVREVLIEYLIRHPNTQLAVTEPQTNASRHVIANKLLDMRVPYDMIITNMSKTPMPPITFKTMMLVGVLNEPEYDTVLMVDTDQEALDMARDAGIPFVYNPLEMRSNAA
jgi:hypothetical protein